MNQKKRTNISSKTIRNRSINYVSIVTLIPLNCSFKISKIYLNRKSSLKDLLRQIQDENKIGKVWLL